MNKRMLLILAVIVSFTPAAFAGGGVGSFDQSNAADTAGASHCSAGIHSKDVASSDVRTETSTSSTTKAGAAY